VAADAGFIGFGVIGQVANGFPASGMTVIADDAAPARKRRHISMPSRRGFRGSRFLAARPAYPWQDEMIAILLHKGNVHYELHGWSPKTFSPALKRKIGGRLHDRIMFGCDDPVPKYEMMVER
jgi:uncharacterized protein